MPPSKQLRCWHCLGKRQLFYAIPDDPKPTWHDCQTCQGKGWTERTESNQLRLDDVVYLEKYDQAELDPDGNA